MAATIQWPVTDHADKAKNVEVLMQICDDLQFRPLGV